MNNKKSLSLSRRAFLKHTASAAGAVTIIPRHVLGGAGHTPPSERLNIASIGAGGRAGDNLKNISHHANIVALCDVDEQRAAEAFKRWPDAAKYKDYRVMLEKHNDIDAVLIGTPDHVHATATLTAMELGKHVYVEKPMAHTIAETRKLVAAAKRYKVATQMGNQGHSFKGCRILKAWLDDDAIGPVRKIQCWTDRPYCPQGIDRPADTPPVPPSLDWDLWLGPAPQRPYHQAYCPHKWRAWHDFGCGALGDMGCHILDGSFWALDLGAPVRIEAESSGVNAETYPKWSIVRYEFPARGDKPPVTLTWYDGGKMPPRPKELAPERRMGDAGGGALLYGDKGIIMTGTYGNGVRIIPEEKMKAYKNAKVKLPRRPNHYEDWMAACKNGTQACSNFDYAAPLTEIVHLGNIALRAGQPIEWNAENMRIPNLPEAEQLLRSSYRKGWEIEV